MKAPGKAHGRAAARGREGTPLIGRRLSCVSAMAVLLLVALPSVADVKFTRLDEDQFVVFHRKLTVWGAEAKAVTKLYEEIASICVAAGYEYFTVKSQDVQERQWGGTWGGGRGAGASAQVKFHDDEGEEDDDRIGCSHLADPSAVAKAKKKLAKGR